jgi:hypothetical protein
LKVSVPGSLAVPWGTLEGSQVALESSGATREASMVAPELYEPDLGRFEVCRSKARLPGPQWISCGCRTLHP